MEAAVLRLLLIEHPDQLTVEELERALLPPAGVAGTTEEIAVAVRALAGGGLVHVSGERLVPSRAALYFDRLPID